ncbi:hypothetical protein CLU95_4563 [Variovorax sp. 54]|uniref:hypothetical protein n=1 Tax=Variovorax sp. 54 TaxID=2035212 RepID=UPI000C19D7A0|nr:hypothetical protein [Variovorax sp. 54]PIF77389.1 hypothetical protein CLU95_4563 [Variovorax sp. 54]
MKFPLICAAIGIVVAALMAGGYFAARPSPNPAAQDRAQKRSGSRFAVQIAATADPEGAPLPLLRIARGDVVSIAVTSAQPGQLMVHGYMQEMVPVAAGQTVSLHIAALHAGRYPLHLHGDDQSHREVAFLEIQP